MRKKMMKVTNNRLMMVIGLSFIIYHLSFSPVNAQTFTQRVQTQMEGEGTVIIHHDAVIDELVNGTNVVAEKPVPNKQNSNKPTPNKQQNATPDKPVQNQQSNQTQQSNGTEGEQVCGTTGSTEVSVKRYKTTGYRVQVFRGGNSKNDRQRAESAGARMREAFPGEEVYIEFYAPDWICRVGNFRDIEDARRVRDEVRKMGYDAATIVKGKIIVSIPVGE